MELTQAKKLLPKILDGHQELIDKISIGSLVYQKKDKNKRQHEFGIIIDIKDLESPATNMILGSKEVKIFWFDHRVSFTYSLVDVEWFLMGKERALWEIFN